jgi:hypothetical protein
MKTIEARFKEMLEFPEDLDMTKFPLLKGGDVKVKSSTTKVKKYGEVFTPLWLVDKMILLPTKGNVQAAGEKLYNSVAPMDLCAGYGQFTVRMLRCMTNTIENFDPREWLKKHTFSELQEESVKNLLYIFGNDINVFIGDARLIERPQKGIYAHSGKEWVNYER